MSPKVNVGDAFVVGPLMPGICDEQVLLTAIGDSDKDGVEEVTFDATFFGVHLCKALCRVDSASTCTWEVK